MDETKAGFCGSSTVGNDPAYGVAVEEEVVEGAPGDPGGGSEFGEGVEAVAPEGVSKFDGCGGGAVIGVCGSGVGGDPEESVDRGLTSPVSGGRFRIWVISSDHDGFRIGAPGAVVVAIRILRLWLCRHIYRARFAT